MRVKLGKSIHFCTKCTHPTESHLVLLTTSNGVYTVDMVAPDQAKIVVRQLLTNGWFDFSDYNYSN